MIIYGRNPVFEAVRAGKAHKIYIRKGAGVYDVTFNVEVKVLGRDEFDGRFAKDAQGLAAEVDDIETLTLEDAAAELSQARGVVILDRIQDPNNYGAIIRSAHCFGINHIVVPRYHQAPLTPAVYKASAGALFYTKIIEETNLGQTCSRLKEMGYTVVACDMQADTPLTEFKSSGKTALIIGSEGRGLREGLIAGADELVKIPMKGSIDSLNAANSASIFMYEIFVRQ